MRVIIAVITIALGMSISSSAQNFDVKITKSVDLYDGLDEEFYSGTNFGVKNPIYSAYPVTEMIRYNRVDGLFIGIQEEKMDWNSSNFLGIQNVDIHGMVGYSVAQQEIQYAIGAEKSIGVSHKWLLLGGDLHRSTSTEDYWRSGLFENSLTAFTMGYDFHDYYKAEGFGIYSLIRPYKFLELGASYNSDKYSSLEAQADFSLISRYSTYRINPAIDASTNEINQQSLNLGVKLNPLEFTRQRAFWTTISTRAELANVSGFNNDFMYNSYEAELKSFLRVDHSTLLKWRLMAGSITGEAPDFKNFALGGIGTMRALGYKSLIGNQMMLSNFELELGKDGDHKGDWVDLSSLYVTFFLDSGFSHYIEDNLSTNDPFENYEVEFSNFSHNAGAGIGFGSIRFEVSQPVAGVGGQTSFWIRFNPTF